MSEFIASDANMEQSKLASDLLGLGRDACTALPCWLLLQQWQVQIYSFNSNPPFLSAGQDFCDGASLSRPRPRATSFALTSTPAALLGHDRHLQEAERYSFADENQDGKAEGQLGMNPSTGDFSVTEKIGELFYKEHISWIKDSSGKKVGECFSLKSSSYPLYYFALDSSSEDFTVKGMTLESLSRTSDRYWTYEWFSSIGGSQKSKSVVLRYWGNRFGDPSQAPYYFLIEPEDNHKFKFTIGPPHLAVKYGALGVYPHN